MGRREKLVAGLSVGAAALFLLIVLCVSGGGDEETSRPEPELAAVVEPAPVSQALPPAAEPQAYEPFGVEFTKSFAEVIQPGPLPAKDVAPAAEELPAPPEPAVRELVRLVEEEKQPEREPARYLVKPGETYCSIAKKVYGSARYFLDLELANGIEPHRLRAEQRIVMPRIEGVELNLPQEAPGLHEPEADEYVIQPGDTLGHISLKLYGTSRAWKKLVEANPGLDPRRLLPETTIAVPPLGEDARSPQ